MDFYTFQLDLCLVAPFVSQLSGARKFGVDSALLRDENGNCGFPGSLIQGVIRENLVFFAKYQPELESKINDWFGQASDQNKDIESWEPIRGKLIPSQYWVAQNNSKDELIASEPSTFSHPQVRYRIQMNEQTGTVKDGAYQVIESPYTSGTKVIFSGTFSIYLDHDKKADEIQYWLSKAIQYTDALGAFKGIGFGAISHNDTKWFKWNKQAPQHLDDFSIGHSQPTNLSFGVRLKPDRHFCFARLQSNQNAFVSQDIIPGAALIAAIMDRINSDQKSNSFPILKKYIDQCYVSHAKAIDENQTDLKRTSVIPLSWVSDGEKIYDLALKKGPGLFTKAIKGKKHYIAPKFIHDWKTHDFDLAQQQLHIAHPKRLLQVHTKIDPDTGAAEEKKLFSVESISPQGHYWLSNFICKDIAVEEKKTLEKELEELFKNPLQKMGKTKAATENVQISAVFPSYPEQLGLAQISTNQAYCLVITLQSDTRMFPFNEKISHLDTNNKKDLFQTYCDYWQTLSKLNNNAGLKLSHYFAEQKLVGGEYFKQRFFQQQSRSAKAYNPELLTLAGSVFVFYLEKAQLDVLKPLIESWQLTGLPQMDDNNNWRHNPYLAQNGYGEISVNLACHKNMEPKTNWEEI